MLEPNQENVINTDNIDLSNSEDIDNGKGMVDIVLASFKKLWAIHFCKRMCKASFKLFNVSKKERPSSKDMEGTKDCYHEAILSSDAKDKSPYGMARLEHSISRVYSKVCRKALGVTSQSHGLQTN